MLFAKERSGEKVSFEDFSFYMFSGKENFLSASRFSASKKFFLFFYFSLPHSGLIHLIRIGCIVRNFLFDVYLDTCVTKIDLSVKDVVSSSHFSFWFFATFAFFCFMKSGNSNAPCFHGLSRTVSINTLVGGIKH